MLSSTSNQNGTSTPKYKSPYSPRVNSLRQQVIAGHPATRLSPYSQYTSRVANRGQQMSAKKTGERRISEAAISRRPPLPPNFSSGRSQSLDGLLDESGGGGSGVDGGRGHDDEGASDVVDGMMVGGGSAAGAAVSLEVLLDETEEQPVKRPPRREERSKSVDNYLGEKSDQQQQFDSLPRTRSPSEKFCERETLVVDEAKEVPSVCVTAHDTAYNSEEEGPPREDEEGDSRSTTPSTAAMSRQNSTTSSEVPERKKTFINRLGKRVRSMIKK